MQGLITSHESLTSAMISLQVRLLDQLRPTLLSSINPCSLSHIHFRVQMVLRVLGGSSNPPPRLQVSFVRGGGRLAKFILVEMQLAHSIGETVECRLGVSQWASQLSLVGCRPHHFDSTRTADITNGCTFEAAHCVPTSPPPEPQTSLGAWSILRPQASHLSPADFWTVKAVLGWDTRRLRPWMATSGGLPTFSIVVSGVARFRRSLEHCDDPLHFTLRNF